MLSSLVTAFRQHYPQGSLVSELVSLQEGLYVVRVTVTVDNQILSSALAAHGTLELADDLALERALSRLAIPNQGDGLMPTTVISASPPSWAAIPPVEPPAAEMPLSPAVAAPASGLAEDKPSPPKLVALATNGFHAAPVEATAVEEELPLLAEVAPDEPEAFLPTTISGVTLGPRPLDLPATPEFTVDLSAPLEAPSLEHDLLNLEGIPTPSIDLSDIIAQTDVELQRLGWGVRQGREFLEKTYGKRSRHDLTDEELLEFLLFLETQPTLEPGS